MTVRRRALNLRLILRESRCGRPGTSPLPFFPSRSPVAYSVGHAPHPSFPRKRESREMTVRRRALNLRLILRESRCGHPGTSPLPFFPSRSPVAYSVGHAPSFVIPAQAGIQVSGPGLVCHLNLLSVLFGSERRVSWEASNHPFAAPLCPRRAAILVNCSSAASRSSAISAAMMSGGGSESVSVRLLSLIQKRSRFSLSRFSRSS